ncbi:hypothetical protein SAMN04488127_0667 [Bhargavaea ginsengi]|uniref:Uncharacterized protein n=1 Tax=Bhargavaea ginsengi TaxID=426757 RepID=A0A1H6U8U3_9BACL|nr:hypothetical protein SAMN04488127_0667 [Bhargavaea ginsengi]
MVDVAIGKLMDVIGIRIALPGDDEVVAVFAFMNVDVTDSVQPLGLVTVDPDPVFFPVISLVDPFACFFALAPSESCSFIRPICIRKRIIGLRFMTGQRLYSMRGVLDFKKSGCLGIPFFVVPRQNGVFPASRIISRTT